MVVPASSDGLFPAVGMHSLGEEVRLDLQAEWGSDEDDSAMMVDSHEDEWSRLHDVRVSGTVRGGGVGGHWVAVLRSLTCRWFIPRFLVMAHS